MLSNLSQSRNNQTNLTLLEIVDGYYTLSRCLRNSFQDTFNEYTALHIASVPEKRCHNHDNSYTRKNLIVTCLEFQRFIPLLSLWGTCQCAGRRGAGGVESYFYIWIHRQQEESHWAWIGLLKCQRPLQVACFIQQEHTYSNKATLPNPSK